MLAPPSAPPLTLPGAATVEPICTLDLEASGFGRGSYPIEVGWVCADGKARCTLIQPVDDWQHWDASAEQVHGISRDALWQHGRPAREVAEWLNRDLAGRTVYCDAWAHDYPWLARLFDAAQIALRFRLESVLHLVPASELPRLPGLQRQALLSMGLTRHRASNDARALQQALLVLQSTCTLPAGPR